MPRESSIFGPWVPLPAPLRPPRKRGLCQPFARGECDSRGGERRGGGKQAAAEGLAARIGRGGVHGVDARRAEEDHDLARPELRELGLDRGGRRAGERRLDGSHARLELGERRLGARRAAERGGGRDAGEGDKGGRAGDAGHAGGEHGCWRSEDVSFVSSDRGQAQLPAPEAGAAGT